METPPGRITPSRPKPKIYNYVSGEIGIIGRAQDASHYYQLSLRRDESGNKKWWLLKNDGGVVTVLASASSISRAAITICSGSGCTSSTSRLPFHIDKGLSFNALGFAEDAQYRSGKIGLITRNTKGVFDNVAVNTLGGAKCSALRARRNHVARKSELRQRHRQPLHAVPQLTHRQIRASHQFLCQFPPIAARLFCHDNRPGLFTKEGPIPPNTNNIVRALATRIRAGEVTLRI